MKRRNARKAGHASSAPRRAYGSGRKVQVAVTQMACTPDPRDNRARDGAQVVCTQELFASQYFCQAEDYRSFALAETIPGPSTEAFARVAKKHKTVLVASLFEKRTSGLYHNTAVVLDADGSNLGLYRKMHIPDDPLYYEKFFFTPGDLGFRAFQTRYGRIGVLICWDQWYPEGARLTALQGAEILFYPTAIGWHPAEKAEHGHWQHQSWELIQRSHAVANGCFVAVPNRVGHELVAGPDGEPVSPDGIEFWGQSFIAAPGGRILAKASPDRDEILTAECDLQLVEYHRTHWPFLRDRRIDAYQDLTRRYIGD
jgi:N-carbamoylputrescine amidase